MIPIEFTRTLSTLRRLADGEHITLSDGRKIGMGKDMSIGFITAVKGRKYIINPFGLEVLHQILTEESLGLVKSDQ